MNASDSFINYGNPRIICEFLTPSPRVRGGLGWGKKLTTHLGLLYVAKNRVVAGVNAAVSAGVYYPNLSIEEKAIALPFSTNLKASFLELLGRNCNSIEDIKTDVAIFFYVTSSTSMKRFQVNGCPPVRSHFSKPKLFY